MPTAAYLAQLANFSRIPALLVRWTVPGDLVGSQIFYFTETKISARLSIQIGKNVLPYLLRGSGRPTRIRPDQALTERARITLEFQDDPAPMNFTSTVFTVNAGGSFFRRIVVAQPDYVGTSIEVLRGFIATGFLESDFETIFKGRVEDIDFANEGRVSVVAKDILNFIDRNAPSEVGDDNLFTGVITPTTTSIPVSDGTKITDPATLPSKDFAPVVIRAEPGTANEEDIIIGAKSGNTLTVQANYLNASEDFSDTSIWVPTASAVVDADASVGPFGGNNLADQLTCSATAHRIEQTTATPASDLTMVFSVWLRATATAGGTITIGLGGSTGGYTTSVVTLTDRWQRFEVVRVFAGLAGTARVKIERAVGDLTDVQIFGAQLEIAAARGFYAATLAASAGATAGRNAFVTYQLGIPTAAVLHDLGKNFIEVLVYRNQLNDDGVHPIFILRDLLNRGLTPTADIDTAVFNTEFLFVEGMQLRRGPISGFSVIDTTISKARNLLQLVKEVREQSLIDIWVGENGKVKARYSWRVSLPTDTVNTITDESNIVLKSSSYAGNKQSRITRLFTYFNIRENTLEGKQPEDFLNVQAVVDTEAEDPSGERSIKIFSRWIFRTNEALSLGGRILSRFKRGARIATWEMEIKDDTILPIGEVVKLNSNDILIASGANAIRGDSFWQLTAKEWGEPGILQVEALETRQSRFFFIGPSSLPSDYDSASPAERFYGFIGTAGANKVGTALDNGYYIL